MVAPSWCTPRRQNQNTNASGEKVRKEAALLRRRRLDAQGLSAPRLGSAQPRPVSAQASSPHSQQQNHRKPLALCTC
ncbi:hypothetical protein PF010_g20949 [Phytophthora fragariae]|uniref:Uncharacterized protein n=1 Tax=Phytophthora fragariae TaxID=53985 RepID=A0A6G0N6T9_9STRA|nr:hypothetical protein PF010_g20949 [Phytophthora fragariae]KAE9195362.1 hypothetical protein PF004_g20447 [Phytophthora fragariae]